MAQRVRQLEIFREDMVAWRARMDERSEQRHQDNLSRFKEQGEKLNDVGDLLEANSGKIDKLLTQTQAISDERSRVFKVVGWLIGVFFTVMSLAEWFWPRKGS